VSAPTLVEIRSAVADVVATVTGLHAYAYAPDNPAVPCAFLVPTGCEFIAHGRGADQWTFDLVVLAATSSDRAGQEALDAFIGPGARSIRAAIWADRTLGAVVSDCIVSAVRDYGFDAPADGVRYFRAVLEIQVLAPGV